MKRAGGGRRNAEEEEEEAGVVAAAAAVSLWLKDHCVVAAVAAAVVAGGCCTIRETVYWEARPKTLTDDGGERERTDIPIHTHTPLHTWPATIIKRVLYCSV